ncbi:hypothetical protein Lalb_Chr22g0359591 [Lupinus albus]|uniref:Uncharacterized protein n=1 Tax=Lupinus albus TaxID=3870 RepID=A0A6A4NH65_LUPAL|nr:hypothetical protein Lalb_Chr22g0359591 [Lupinus albus]
MIVIINRHSLAFLTPINCHHNELKGIEGKVEKGDKLRKNFEGRKRKKIREEECGESQSLFTLF